MARNTKELREQAVAEARAGRPLLELALQLGVSTNTVRTWLRNANAKAKARDSARRVAATLSREKTSESSQRMRLLIHALEQSPATIIVTDAEGRIIYANPKFAETTGYTVAEAVGQNPRFLKSGYTSPDEYRSLWKALLSGKEWRGEFHNRRKDGSLYWERASISPVYDAEGRIANFMAVKENITEFKEAELARQRAEEHFRAVLTAMAEGMLLLDAQGRIVLANPAAENLLNQLPGRLLGRRLGDLRLRWLNEGREPLPPEALPDRRVLGQGEAADGIAIALVLSNGHLRWLRINARAVVPASPEAAAVLSLADITERKARDDQLALAALLFDQGEAAMVLDAHHRLAAVNDAFLLLAGYGRDELLGKSPDLLAAGRQRGTFCPQAWPALSATGSWQGPWQLRAKNGRLIAVRLSIAAVRGEGGAIQHYVATIHQ